MHQPFLVDRLTLAVYVIIGCLAGLGGFILSARLNSSEAVAGQGYELTVIASVVIGPGDIAQAHAPDESVALDDLDWAAEVFAAALRARA